MEHFDSTYYRRLANFAGDAGEIMIRSGAETHRVEDTMSRILDTTGFPTASTFVLPTGIMLTLSDHDGETISLNRRVTSGSTDLNSVCEVNRISRAFCAGALSLEDAEKELAAMKNVTIYSRFLRIFGCMIGCAGFAVVFGGGLVEFGIALLCGLFLGLETTLLRPLIGKPFISDALGAAISSFLAVLFSYFLGSFLPGTGTILVSSVIAGCIMPLVPGVAITNAIRDTFAGDYLSAAARAIEAFLIATSIAIGVGLGIAAGMALQVTDGINFGNGTYNYYQCIAACLSVLGFCVLFKIPKKFIIPAAICGAICWAVYVLCLDTLGLSAYLGVYLATMAVDIYSQICARALKVPVTVPLIAGIVLLVPGLCIYQAVYYLIEGASALASAALTQTLFTAGTIALAIFTTDTVVRIIFPKKKKKSK